MDEGERGTNRLVDRQNALNNYLGALFSECSAETIGNTAISADAVTSPSWEPAVPTIVEESREPLFPDWAGETISLVFFRIGTWRLSCPLIQISRSFDYSGSSALLPGQIECVEGIITDQKKKITLLNTAALLMDPSIRHQTTRFSCVLVTADEQWGLLCDEVVKLAVMPKDQIRWRRKNRQPNWRFGTIIDELSVLIDLQLLISTKF